MKNILFVFFVILLVNKAIANNEICGKTHYYRVEFEPITYNCNINQYLPAGGILCEQCPINHKCTGGSYTYSSTQTQGLDDGDILVTDAIGSCVKNFNKSYSAIFEPIMYTCAPGYYLPAGDDWIDDVEGCRICPQNNKCVGGTYIFNETEFQGIESCINPTPFAPIGSAICYEHILHIGDDMVYLKSTKTTTPSLNIGMDDGIFYANMTTIPTTMNNSTEHYLKMLVNGAVYYVCDDSTYRE